MEIAVEIVAFAVVEAAVAVGPAVAVEQVAVVVVVVAVLNKNIKFKSFGAMKFFLIVFLVVKKFKFLNH